MPYVIQGVGLCWLHPQAASLISFFDTRCWSMLAPSSSPGPTWADLSRSTTHSLIIRRRRLLVRSTFKHYKQQVIFIIIVLFFLLYNLQSHTTSPTSGRSHRAGKPASCTNSAHVYCLYVVINCLYCNMYILTAVMLVAVLIYCLYVMIKRDTELLWEASRR